jgi:hypothetical protein
MTGHDDGGASASGGTGASNGNGASKGHRFTPKEKEAALIALALSQGNCAAAARALKEEGITVSESTLNNWKATPAYADTYTNVIGQIREVLAAEYEGSARLAINKTNDVLDAFTVEGLKPHESAGAARNLMTTAGIAQDKANVLRGMPNEIRQLRTIPELDASIARRLGQQYVLPNPDVDSTAEETELAEDSPLDPEGRSPEAAPRLLPTVDPEPRKTSRPGPTARPTGW